ncbi:MAG: TIGR01777 family oxidoreductase [Bacteroidota bacterium]
MKVLVTGATGLVGQAIVKVLRSKDIDVNYLTRNKNKITSSEGYHGYYWNPEKGEMDLDVLKDVSAVINLAGASISNRWTNTYKKKVLNSRIDSLMTLHQGFQQVDTSRITSFVTASAIGIYPNSLTHFYDESEKQIDSSFLGEVVDEWEKAADRFRNFDFKTAKVRIGLVLANSGGALPKMARPVQGFVGAAFGSGEQWQSWIHVDDLAEMFVFLIENNLKGTYNGVAPNPVTQSKMIKTLGKVLNRPIWLPNIPKFVMKGLLGEMSYLLFASQRVSSKRIEKKGFDFQYPNLEAALENLYGKNMPENESQISNVHNGLA